MTQEEKELLLKDLCARLPYNVKINIRDYYSQKMVDDILCAYHIGGISYNLESRNLRPYLRPMSSMTEEEYKEYSKLWDLQDEFPTDADIRFKIDVFNWLNAHHFDYRGLIEKGLALEAPKDMYNNN